MNINTKKRLRGNEAIRIRKQSNKIMKVSQVNGNYA